MQGHTSKSQYVTHAGTKFRWMKHVTHAGTKFRCMYCQIEKNSCNGFVALMNDRWNLSAGCNPSWQILVLLSIWLGGRRKDGRRQCVNHRKTKRFNMTNNKPWDCVHGYYYLHNRNNNQHTCCVPLVAMMKLQTSNQRNNKMRSRICSFQYAIASLLIWRKSPTLL